MLYETNERLDIDLFEFFFLLLCNDLYLKIQLNCPPFFLQIQAKFRILDSKLMSMKSIVVTITFLFIFLNVNGQKIYRWYQDGKIIFELAENQVKYKTIEGFVPEAHAFSKCIN